MAAPLFNRPKPPQRTALNNEGLAIEVLAAEGAQRVIVSPDHLGLWLYVQAVLRDRGELKFPNKIPAKWVDHPPDVWLVPPKDVDRDVIRGMTKLFESIGATVHEGAPSRFDRRDPV